VIARQTISLGGESASRLTLSGPLSPRFRGIR